LGQTAVTGGSCCLLDPLVVDQQLFLLIQRSCPLRFGLALQFLSLGEQISCLAKSTAAGLSRLQT
jgi:hypothetical protein